MYSESDLAALPAWPADVLGESADFLRQGFSYQLRDNRQYTEMAAGPPRSRLMSKQTIADLNGTLLLSEAYLQHFNWWWVNAIDHGNDLFTMQLMTGAGLNTVVAKFASNGRGASLMSGQHFRMSCKLIVIELPGVGLDDQPNLGGN